MSSPFYYRLNKKISGVVSRIMNLATARSADAEVDISREPIRKILLVRGNFRMGDCVLASPAILLFRKNFPDARIDFVGSPMSRALFQNLPIDRHYEITRRFPGSNRPLRHRARACACAGITAWGCVSSHSPGHQENRPSLTTK